MTAVTWPVRVALARTVRGHGGNHYPRHVVTRLGSALARFLRPRRRQITWAVLLGLLSVLLLALAARLTGYPRDLLVNVGAGLLMVGLTFVVFDPLFDDMRRNAVQEHRTLDFDRLIGEVRNAELRVDMLDTWTGLLEERHKYRFLDALQVAASREVPVRLLLLDPDSAAAEQRSEELDNARVPFLIMDNLLSLYRLRAGLPRSVADQLQVRIYDASPSIQLYRWDDKALVSFFPVGRKAYDAPQLEAFMDSPLGEFVEGRFDELWGRARPLDDFMTLVLTVRLDERTLGTESVPFVRLGHDWYVDGSALKRHLFDHGAPNLRVHSAAPLPVGGGPATTFAMARLDGEDRPLVAAVLEQFDAKYGREHDETEILRLRLDGGG